MVRANKPYKNTGLRNSIQIKKLKKAKVQIIDRGVKGDIQLTEY